MPGGSGRPEPSGARGRARAPVWAYVLAAIAGSFAGSVLDMLLIGGGYTLTKVGLVAGPVLMHFVLNPRGGGAAGSEAQE